MDRIASRIAFAAALALGTALGGCADDMGYGGFGAGYAGQWGDPYWGWYGDYYYPGTGYYVYDRNRHRQRWTPEQQRYWQGRNSGWHGDRGHMRNNWHDFSPGRGHPQGHPPRR